MSDVNLLPQDMRNKEEKERTKLAKKPRVFEIELSQPKKDKLSKFKKSGNEKSLWKKIFGEGKKSTKIKAVDPKASMPISKPSLDVDMLSAARTQKKVYKQDPKKGGFSGVKFRIHDNDKQKKAPPVPDIKNSFGNSIEMKKPNPTIDLKSVKFDEPNKANDSKDNKKTGRIITEDIEPDKTKSKTKSKSFHFGLATLRGKGKKFKLNINLVPDELAFKDEVGLKRRIIALALAVIVTGLAVFGAYSIIGVFQKKVDEQLSVKRDRVLTLTKEVGESQHGKTETAISQKKLLALDKIFKNHIYWTKFFGLLEKYTLDGVYYDGMSADINGQVDLPVTANSYQEGAKQIVVFENANDFIKSVNVGNISLDVSNKQGVSGVSFDLKIKLIDNILTAAN